jgi:hypothetical protein
VLENEPELNKIFTISFWEIKKNTEYYEKELDLKMKAMIETFFAEHERVLLAQFSLGSCRNDTKCQMPSGVDVSRRRI